MSRKLGVLMLSLAVVMFGAASAFAYFISEDIANFVSYSPDFSETPEGYNYYQEVFISDDSWPESESADKRIVSWEIEPKFDWVQTEIDGNKVILKGVLPAFSTSLPRLSRLGNPYTNTAGNNVYTIHVIAHLSCDVPVGYDAYGEPLMMSSDVESEDDIPILVSGEIAADVDADQDTLIGGLVIEVQRDQTFKPLSEVEKDLVSVDVSGAAQGIGVAAAGYSVLIHFPMTVASEDRFVVDDEDEPVDMYTRSTDVSVNAKLNCDPAPQGSGYVLADDDIDLPYWLGYEITEIQYEGSYNYEENDDGSISSRTYSQDEEPVVKTLRIFRKSGTAAVSGDQGSIRIVTAPSDKDPSIGPDDAPNVGPDGNPIATLAATYGESVKIGWNVTFSGSDVEPDPIKLDPTTANIIVEAGKTATTDAIAYSQADFASATFSTAPAGVTLTAAGANGKITITATATAEAPASGPTAVTMTVTDANGKTATATINVTVTVPAPPVPSGDITFDAGNVDLKNLVFPVGGSGTYNLTIGNTLGGVTWSIVSDFLSMISPTSGEGNNVSFTINTTNAAPGNYTATLQARDSSGRDAGSYTFNWKVEEPTPVVLAIELSSIDVAVSVDFGASADLKVGYTNQEPATITFEPDISKDVKLSWDKTPMYLNGIPNGTITIHAEPLTPAAKLYSTDIIATDANGKSDRLTLTIDVKYTAPVPPTMSFEITPASASVTVSVDVSSDVSFEAVGASGDVTWTVDNANTGVTIAPTSEQTGAKATYTVTGVAAGSYTATVKATNGDRTATATIAITVRRDGQTPPPPPDSEDLKVSPDKAAVTVTAGGASANVSFTAIGNSGDVTWSVGALPNNGLTVTSNGDGSFTVAAAPIVDSGDYDVTVTAENGGRTATATITITVERNGNPVPVPAELKVSPETREVRVTAGGASETASFTAEGASGDVTWSVENNGGVTVTSNGGGSFTVSAASSVTAGSHTATVKATNGERTATATINVTVLPAPTPVITISQPSRSVTVTAGGDSTTVTFTAANNVGTVTWSVVNNGGVTVTSDGDGKFTVSAGSSVAAGSYTATVRATDSTTRRTADATINITVEENPSPEPPDEDTQRLIDGYKQSGALDDDGTIPDDAVEYVASDPTAKTLNPNTTTQVRQNEDINPIALVLEFPVDIWRIYINNVLAAEARSPEVANAGFDNVYASTGESGVIIEPKSKTEATVVFNPANMQTGSSEIAAAFVPNAAKPTQEIGRTKLADVNITSSTTSPDEEIQGVGDSGGGCSAGLGAIVSAIAAAFFISKKRS